MLVPPMLTIVKKSGLRGSVKNETKSGIHRNEMQYRSYIYSGHINSKKLEYNPVSIRALSWKYGNKISCRCADGSAV